MKLIQALIIPLWKVRGFMESVLASQEEPTEPQGQKKDDQESVGSMEPTNLLAPAAPMEELLQFLESTLHSGNKVQLTLDRCGDFHQVLNSMRALVREGKGHKQSNSKNYQWALSFHKALYIYGGVTGLLMGPATCIAACKSPAKPNNTPHRGPLLQLPSPCVAAG